VSNTCARIQCVLDERRKQMIEMKRGKIKFILTCDLCGARWEGATAKGMTDTPYVMLARGEGTRGTELEQHTYHLCDSCYSRVYEYLIAMVAEYE
jgi:hypothetical protein